MITAGRGVFVILAGVCLALPFAATAASKNLTITCNTKEDFDRCTRDVNIEVSDDGTVGLRKSVMIQDELGATHYTNAEQLSPTVWAKKQFVIDDPACDSAQLYVYRSVQSVRVNGAPLMNGRSHPSTGWQVWDVPPQLLRKGINEFVFSGGGELLIEQSLFPNRSAKSANGGKSWEYDGLGYGDIENGEYLARLRLTQYPSKGTITSSVIDLAEMAADGPIRPRVDLQNVDLHADCKIPESTQARFELRAGSTASYDPSQWSEWQPADRFHNATFAASHRYLQWRAVLDTKSGRVSPILKSVRLAANLDSVNVSAGSTRREIRITEQSQPGVVQHGSYPFAYQRPGGRLQHLRDRYKLDEVVAKGKTELEKFVLLREWVRFTAPKGWDSGTTQWCPPWDALIILETNKQPIALCMCTHYSTVFVQCALALGYNARHVILDHHCIAEVWSNQFRKWIVIDTGCSTDPELNCHFEQNGVPLNALEIHNLWKAKRTNEIEVVYTPPRGRINGSDIGKKSQCGFDNYRRFAIPFRNNHLVMPYPGELEQGFSEYFCDLYLWWEDQAVPTQSPEYGKKSCRNADLYWTLNETAIDLQESDQADALQVSFDTVTPNFDRFIVSMDGGSWETRSGSFVWKLHTGENTLRVKSVNTFGVEGIESQVRLSLK